MITGAFSKVIPWRLIVGVALAIAAVAFKFINDRNQRAIGKQNYVRDQMRDTLKKLKTIKEVEDSVNAMSDDDVERELRKYRKG